MATHDTAVFLHVRFSVVDPGLIGRANFPEKNEWGVPVFDVNADEQSVSFGLIFHGDTARFEGSSQPDSIDGQLKMRNGATARLRLIHRMAYDSAVVRPLAGNYRIAGDRIISMGPMDEANGWLSFFDSKTRRGGILYGLSDSVFFTGPSYSIDYPIAIRADVHRDARGRVMSFTWRERGQKPVAARRRDDVRTEEIAFHNGSVRLAGMIALPKAGRRHPAVILIHGCCGTVPTRDFGYWSAYLAGHGFAVLSYDRRGGGASGGDFRTATYEDVADDVVAGLTYLQSRPDIDPSRIGLYGMSNGGYIAPLAAARAGGRVAFIAVRSGSARRVGDNIAYEVGNDLRSEGFAASDVERGVAIRQRVTDFVIARPVMTAAAWDSLQAEVATLSQEKWFPWARVGWVPLISVRDSAGISFLNALRSDWQYDPLPYWREVRVPVYVMLGALDRSVPTAESAPLLRAALRDAGISDATVRVFPNGNHGLMEAQTGFERGAQANRYYVAGFQGDLIAWMRKQVAAGRTNKARD